MSLLFTTVPAVLPCPVSITMELLIAMKPNSLIEIVCLVNDTAIDQGMCHLFKWGPIAPLRKHAWRLLVILISRMRAMGMAAQMEDSIVLK